MNIDEAKENLIEIFGYEYQSYITMKLAGDFAVILSEKLNPDCTCSANHENYSNTAEVVICTKCNGILNQPLKY